MFPGLRNVMFPAPLPGLNRVSLCVLVHLLSASYLFFASSALVLINNPLPSYSSIELSQMKLVWSSAQ